MSERPPLALIVVSPDPTRLRAALVLAHCEIALGGQARLFLQGEAVPLVRQPVTAAQDGAWRAAGEPALAELLDEALKDGVAISLCQTGLAQAGLQASALDMRIELSGPLAFLAAVGPDVRLLAF